MAVTWNRLTNKIGHSTDQIKCIWYYKHFRTLKFELNRTTIWWILGNDTNFVILKEEADILSYLRISEEIESYLIVAQKLPF